MIPDITILGQQVVLDQPASITERYDVIASLSDGVASHRVAAAALALCWPWLRRRLIRQRIVPQGDVARYGQGVLDQLLGAGAPYADILAAGQRAIDLCGQDLPGIELPETKGEAEELVGNSSEEEGSPST